MKYSPYSNSKINLFFQCPFKWKLNYIDKVRVPMSTDYFERGNFYHFVLQHFPKLPPQKFAFKIASKDKQEELVQNVKTFIKLPEVHEMLTKWSLKREETCNLTESFKWTNNKKAALFTGYIDYIGQEKPGEIIVADWKSSKNYTPNEFQLQLYATWAFAVMPNIQRIKTGFCYVEDKSLEWQYFEREQHESSLRELVINKIGTIEECSAFNKKPSKHCDRCEYFGKHCKPFNVAVPQEMTNG